MRCIPFTNLAIFALILCLFASCRRDDITLELSDQPLLINNAAKMLKGSTMNSSWSADESFGLFLKPTGSSGFTELLELNRKYMYNANLSVFQIIGNPIYYPLSGNVDLIAYTPFKEDLTTIYPIDISNQENQKGLELLYSNSAQNINKDHGSLSLSFDQQLSKLTFNLRREDGTVAGLESFSIALQGFYNTAKFDLSSGEIFDKVSSQTINLGTSREAIVIPHTDPITRSFKFHIGASEWKFDLPLGDTFEPGKKYDYTITISAHAVDVELTTISPWILDSSLPSEGGLDSNPIEFAYIPPGTFQMGAPDSSTTANSNAKPQHWVKISKGFFMSKHEITVAQYAEFLNANHVEKGSSSQVSHLIDGTIRNIFNSIVNRTPQFNNNIWVAPTGRENYPMSNVTWYGALAYAKWRGGTLPTEAQWEYAYRAGTKNKFFAGNLDAEMMDYAWYIQNSGGNTHPVGQKKPNPWGLYDMAGNVTEWCLDVNVGYYITAYPSAPNELFPIVDPGEFEDSAIRAYRRGGDFLNSAYFSSAYARIFREKNDLVDNVGFRIVINP